MADDQIIPKPLPRQKNWRWAATLNLILPGAGLIYIGRRKFGVVLAAAFSFCLLLAVGIFLVGYVQYLNVVLGGDLMKEGQIEQLTDVFHKKWLLGLLIAAITLQITSMIILSKSRKQPV